MVLGNANDCQNFVLHLNGDTSKPIDVSLER